LKECTNIARIRVDICGIFLKASIDIWDIFDGLANKFEILCRNISAIYCTAIQDVIVAVFQSICRNLSAGYVVITDVFENICTDVTRG
jgi:hypothetical protein